MRSMRKNENRPVTVKELNTHLTSFKEEIKDMIQNTVRDAVMQLLDFIGQQRIETDEKIEQVRTELKEDIRQVKDDIIQFKDDILHEIVDLRDDVTVVTGYRDMIEDHEERITKIEKSKLSVV